MAVPTGSNGNAEASTGSGILNDVWDETAHQLRVGPAGGGLIASKTVTYAAALNGTGDYDGTGTPLNLFTVSGQVLCAVIAVCSTTLTGAAGTFAVGVSGTTNRFIPVTTATTVAAGATVDHTGLVAAGTTPLTTPNQVAVDTQVIIGTVATADITAGVLTYSGSGRPQRAGLGLEANGGPQGGKQNRPQPKTAHPPTQNQQKKGVKR